MTDSGSTTLNASLIRVCFSVVTCRQLFQNKKSCKALSSSERSLKDGWVNTRSIEQRPVNLEATVTVLRKTILIRWRTASEVDGVALGHESSQGSGSCVDLLAIVSSTGTVDIETRKNFRDGRIQSQHDLNVTDRVLTGDGDGIFGANSGDFRQDAVFDVALNLLDLPQGLLFVEPVKKDIYRSSMSLS